MNGGADQSGQSGDDATIEGAATTLRLSAGPGSDYSGVNQGNGWIAQMGNAG